MGRSLLSLSCVVLMRVNRYSGSDIAIVVRDAIMQPGAAEWMTSVNVLMSSVSSHSPQAYELDAFQAGQSCINHPIHC